MSALRDAARAAVFSCGGRGFVRFADAGEALLVTDALRRAQDAAQKEAIFAALSSAGFVCREENGLLLITPGDALILTCCAAQPECVQMDWDSSYADAAAFAGRLLRVERAPLDGAGRSFVIGTMRLLWQPQALALAGMDGLRAQAAAMMRRHQRAGLYEAGRLLAGWLAQRA